MFKELIKTYKKIILREGKRIATDASLFTMLVLAPLLYVTIYGFVYINKKEVKVELLVIDQDKTVFSRLLIRGMNAHQSVSVTGMADNIQTALKKVNRGDVSGVLLIPRGLEQNAKSGKHSFVKIYVNTTRLILANDINKALAEVTGTLAAGIKINFFRTRGYSYHQAIEMSQPLTGEIRNMFNPADTYGEFMLPGLMILIIHQIIMIAFAMAMAGEVEDQSTHNLLKVAHGNFFVALVGKALYYLLLFSAYTPLIFGIHFKMFNLPTNGNLLLAFLISILAIAAILAISSFIAVFFRNRLGTLQVLGFFSYPVFFVSGYSWPFESLPVVLQWFGNLLPIKPYLTAYNRVVLMDANVFDVAPEIIHLLVLTVFFGLLGAWNIKRVAKAELLRINGHFN